MSRIICLCLVLILCCITVCGCTNHSIEQLLNLDDESYFYLSEAQKIENNIYYINPQDDLLYVTSEEVNNHEVFINKPTDSFVFTNTGLVCLTKQSTLIVYNSELEKQIEIPIDYERYMRGSLGLSTHKNMLIYYNSMIYVYDDDIVKADFDTGKKTKLVEDEAFLIYPYKNGVIYLKPSVSSMDSHKLFFIDRNGNNKLKLFKDKHIYDLTIHDDWVYYVDKNYNFNRFSIAKRQKHMIIENVGIYVFDIVNNKLIYRNDDDVISSELDGTDQKSMITGNPDLIDVNSRLALIGIKVYDLVNDCQTTLESFDVGYGRKFFDGKILGDTIFITIRNYEETQKAAYFYSTSGEQLYRME